MGYMSQIRVLTLLLMAKGNPIVPVAPCLDYTWDGNSWLFPEFFRRRDHVGFHDRCNRSWHLVRVLNSLAQRL